MYRVDATCSCRGGGLKARSGTCKGASPRGVVLEPSARDPRTALGPLTESACRISSQRPQLEKETISGHFVAQTVRQPM
jgi:hypothetical protein